MMPLYQDPWFTFRFAEDRIIPRFHLEGIEVGRQVSVFKMDPGTGERLGLLRTSKVGEGGWVDLNEPIIIRAGEAFIVVPESPATAPQEIAMPRSMKTEDTGANDEAQIRQIIADWTAAQCAKDIEGVMSHYA